MSEIALHWRLREQRYNLEGGVCPNCGRRSFPPRSVCPYCSQQLRPELDSQAGQVFENEEVVAHTFLSAAAD